jgi:hypothetical protein
MDPSTIKKFQNKLIFLNFFTKLDFKKLIDWREKFNLLFNLLVLKHIYNLFCYYN